MKKGKQTEEFLFKEDFFYMANQSHRYEQIEVDKSKLEDYIPFIKEGLEVDISILLALILVSDCLFGLFGI